jgi:predicted MFS family arabinose efflux permease
MWGGSFASHIGNWMQQVAQAWLIYELTGSPFLVGLGGIFHSVPFVLMSLYAGTLVERVDRKQLLIWVQAAYIAVYGTIGVLIATGNIQVWHLYALSTLSAMAGAFENPAHQALLPYLVPRTDLMTAISLNSVLRKGTQLIGPALGGLSVAYLGVANTYFLKTGTFVVVILTLLAIRATNPVEEHARHSHPLRAMAEGFRYVRTDSVIGGLLLMEAVISLFGSYNTMLVIFAKDIFEVGPQGLGVLQSASGAGTILGSLVLASLGNVTHIGRTIAICGVLHGLGVLALAYCPLYLLALPILLLTGVADVTMGALRATVLQLRSRRELLGRVMSLHAMSTRGSGPLGQFQAGTLAQVFGVRDGLAIDAAICIGATLLVVARIPQILKLTSTSEVGDSPGDRPRRDEAALVH